MSSSERPLSGILGRCLLRLIPLVTLAVLPPAGLASPLTYVLEGDLSFEDMGGYFPLPFQVPTGTTIIEVSYSYSVTRTEGEAEGLLDPVLDIGIYDPLGLRGWTGSDLSAFTVSASRDLTTGGCVPGQIPAGAWYIELGLATLLPPATLHYTVEVTLRDDPVGPPFVRPEKEDVVLSGEARWYRGDLHVHSLYGGGAHTLEEVFDYALSAGLDFIALTDHNTFSQQLYLRETQAESPDLLLLYGQEFTSYRGHANVFNLYGPVDYHGTAPGYDVNRVIDEIHRNGGFISPNHPNMPFFRIGNSFMGWGWAYPETDWSQVDFYEVVNGPVAVANVLPNVFNTLAIQRWQELLDEGYRITAVGGSDDHAAGSGEGPIYTPIGEPTTLVYAEELSPPGIFAGLKAGHAMVVAKGVDGPMIDFTAVAGKNRAIVGDTIRGNRIEFRVEITNGQGKTLFIFQDGKPVQGHTPAKIQDDPFVYTFVLEAEAAGRVHVHLLDGLFFSALTNPIFYAPGPPPWQAATTGASTPGAAPAAAPAAAASLFAFLAPLALLCFWRSWRDKLASCAGFNCTDRSSLRPAPPCPVPRPGTAWPGLRQSRIRGSCS